eukprot:CAMPEP_0201591524 /NCGR_PEP_ID=MMETSP0190_2-20130828/189676_1 /ASSEMBLY_ACC=CAM_ASM_000263 /TAXON_ID=37353 /ORGANISM="Rosalina sp." /LENGTH=657 /DNA_ID=CAMNT_0048049897 /DNA_START=53 /DNA_END=2026 /DNA_ORIENTATION=-
MNTNYNNNNNQRNNNKSNTFRANRRNNYNNQQNQHQNQNQNQNRQKTQNSNIYNDLKSKAFKRSPQANANDNNQPNKPKIDVTKSKLKPETESFSQLDSGAEKSFTQLHTINTKTLAGLKGYADTYTIPELTRVNTKLKPETESFSQLDSGAEKLFNQLQLIQKQLAGLKRYADTYTIPELTRVNTQILIWENPTNSWKLQAPTYYAEYLLLLKTKQQQLQQQIFDNQYLSQLLQQQAEETRGLYKRLLNEAPKPALPTFGDEEKQNNVNGNGFNGNMNGKNMQTNHITEIDNSPNEETKEVSEAPSITSQTQKYTHEAPSVSSREYNDDNKTMDTVSYGVKELLSTQAQFLEIDWRYENYKDVPIDARFVSKGVNNVKYMENVVAMFMRKSANAWVPPSHTGKRATDKKVILRKKLRGILNKMTPEKFAKIAAQTMDIVKVFAENKEMMDIIIEVVLGFAIQIPVFGDQYAKLCQHLKAHLPKLGMVCEFQWILDDPDLSNTFRKIVITQTNDLFKSYRNHSPGDIDLDEDGKKIEDQEELDIKKSKLKNNFLAVMTLVAELYNAELVSAKVIFRGIFDALLPPSNKTLSSIDIEGLCRVFERCGKTLEEKESRGVDRYLQKLMSHARKFDFRTKVIVDNIKEMRSKGWEARSIRW